MCVLNNLKLCLIKSELDIRDLFSLTCLFSFTVFLQSHEHISYSKAMKKFSELNNFRVVKTREGIFHIFDLIKGSVQEK